MQWIYSSHWQLHHRLSCTVHTARHLFIPRPYWCVQCAPFVSCLNCVLQPIFVQHCLVALEKICTLPCKVSGRVGAIETLLANIAFVGTTASIHTTLEGMESSDGARAMLRLSAEFRVRKSELTPVCCLLREAGRQQGSQPLALTCGILIQYELMGSRGAADDAACCSRPSALSYLLHTAVFWCLCLA